MSISLIGSASVEANSITIPGTYQSGDLMIIRAYRTNSSTPVIPGGWTSMESFSAASQSGVTAYKVAASGSETSGTWTNATVMQCVVYRGQNASTPVGTIVRNTGSISTATFGALTLSGPGTSWVLGMMNAVGSGVDINTAPAGMTKETGLSTTNTGAAYDTNGSVSSWSSQDKALGVATTWVASVVEILADSGATTTSTSSSTSTSTSTSSTSTSISTSSTSSSTSSTSSSTSSTSTSTTTLPGLASAHYGYPY